MSLDSISSKSARLNSRSPKPKQSRNTINHAPNGVTQIDWQASAQATLSVGLEPSHEPDITADEWVSRIVAKLT